MGLKRGLPGRVPPLTLAVFQRRCFDDVPHRPDLSASSGRSHWRKPLLALALVLLLLAAFVLGANHFRNNYWPFGRQYLSLLIAHLSSLKQDPALSVRLESVFAAQGARVYRIPIDDGLSPSGPFELLSESAFLFIGKCGEVVFADIDDRDAGALAKKASSHLDAHRGPANSTALEPVHCERTAGVKGSALRDGRLYVAMQVRNEALAGLQMVVREYHLADKALRFERELFRSFPPVQGEVRDEFSGGKLALVGEQQLALALGDWEQVDLVQRDGTTMGKVFMIDLADATASEYTRGHRSPSGGLFYDPAARQLWLSEHGPRGGDEINLLHKGANYGWPIVSYGAMYPNDVEGYRRYFENWNGHEGFEKPKMSFVPSIGIGPIAVYPRDGEMHAWRGDLLFAGMKSRTLYRGRRDGDRVAHVEPLLSGYRIRDIRIGAKGGIYLKTDDNRLIRGEGAPTRPRRAQGEPVARSERLPGK